MTKELIIPLEETLRRECSVLIQESQDSYSHLSRALQCAKILEQMKSGQDYISTIASVCLQDSEKAKQGCTSAAQYVQNNSRRRSFISVSISRELSRMIETRSKDGVLLPPDNRLYYFHAGFLLYMSVLYNKLQETDGFER